MASTVIGLDVGTHAVRAVELSLGRGRPVLERMGQVALPSGAVVAGEVVDTAAVSAALRRLWRDVGFSSREVVVGVANARVVARMTEMPAMPLAELRSSLAFHVQDLIPIPIAEAELDFQVTDRIVTDAGDERVRLMLVAAQRQMLETLVAAVSGAGLVTKRIDLVALALIRALHHRPDLAALLGDTADGEGDGDGERVPKGPDVLIGVGAGVTNVVVHEDGVPSFVRTVPSGGWAVTEALAKELQVSDVEAEGAKRDSDADALVSGVRRNAIVPVVGEVVGSLDFHRSSAGLGAVSSVLLAGGGSRLEPFRRALADQLPVEPRTGDPFLGLRIGKVGLDPEVVVANGDIFAVAVGLALSGVVADGDAGRISLLPALHVAKAAERRETVLAGAGVAGVAVLLVALALLRSGQINDAKADARDAQAAHAATEREIATYAGVAALQADVSARQTAVAAALATDVDWVRLMQSVSSGLPPDVWLTSASVSSAQAGGATLQLSGKGGDHPSIASFIEGMSSLDEIDRVWVSSSAREGSDGDGLVVFSATAILTPGAISDRAETLGGTR